MPQKTPFIGKGNEERWNVFYEKTRKQIPVPVPRAGYGVLPVRGRLCRREKTATPYVIPDVDGKVVILHTNDTHGADLDEEGASFGMAGVAQLKKDFEAAGADVLLVSAGDSIMGKPLVSADQGKSAIEFMNAAGYDAMTVGNHELDFGIDNLKALAKDADFPILCADITTEADGKTVFDSNKIFLRSAA